MSYSFNIRCAALAAGMIGVSAKFDEVVAAQPIHETDRAAAEKAVAAIGSLVAEPGAGEELSIAVHGSVSGQNDALRSVSVGVTVHIVPREVADG